MFQHLSPKYNPSTNKYEVLSLPGGKVQFPQMTKNAGEKKVAKLAEDTTKEEKATQSKDGKCVEIDLIQHGKDTLEGQDLTKEWHLNISADGASMARGVKCCCFAVPKNRLQHAQVTKYCFVRTLHTPF